MVVISLMFIIVNRNAIKGTAMGKIKKIINDIKAAS